MRVQLGLFNIENPSHFSGWNEWNWYPSTVLRERWQTSSATWTNGRILLLPNQKTTQQQYIDIIRYFCDLEWLEVKHSNSHIEAEGSARKSTTAHTAADPSVVAKCNVRHPCLRPLASLNGTLNLTGLGVLNRTNTCIRTNANTWTNTRWKWSFWWYRYRWYQRICRFVWCSSSWKWQTGKRISQENKKMDFWWKTKSIIFPKL